MAIGPAAGIDRVATWKSVPFGNHRFDPEWVKADDPALFDEYRTAFDSARFKREEPKGEAVWKEATLALEERSGDPEPAGTRLSDFDTNLNRSPFAPSVAASCRGKASGDHGACAVSVAVSTQPIERSSDAISSGVLKIAWAASGLPVDTPSLADVIAAMAEHERQTASRLSQQALKSLPI